MKKLWLLISLFSVGVSSSAQQLKPGFDKAEYIELLKVTAKHTNPDHYKDVPYPEHFTLAYRSPIVGLENTWELWTNTEHVAAISIRGTTENTLSWLANVYAAMVPAKGELKLGPNDTFPYELAENPEAAVHVGWLLSTAYLSKTMLPKIDSCYKAGIRDILIVGHSQGGGISYLMTAYLYNLQKQKRLPGDIRFKTYCSAGPKPGNLYFAYDYETRSQAGWAYNVVNASDWVPEVPFTVQTTDDFNAINPFASAKTIIRKQKFPKNLMLKHIYNQMDKPSRKAQRKYQKYLGTMMAKLIRKNIPDFEPPAYYSSNNYVRTGSSVVLQGDADYFKLYPYDKEKIFQHHFPAPYLYLAQQLPNE